MTAPLDPVYTRCLAHPHPEHPIQAPRAWCPLRGQCARHQTIMVDRFGRSSRILSRRCGPDTDDFLPVEEAHP